MRGKGPNEATCAKTGYLHFWSKLSYGCQHIKEVEIYFVLKAAIQIQSISLSKRLMQFTSNVNHSFMLVSQAGICTDTFLSRRYLCLALTAQGTVCRHVALAHSIFQPG